MYRIVWGLLTFGLVTACRHQPSVEQSVAQVTRIRAAVTMSAPDGKTEDVMTVRRVGRSNVVRTRETGRAVLTLDGGGRYVLDRNSAVRVTGPCTAVLESGRLWVAGGEGRREEETSLAVGPTVLRVGSARASVERVDTATNVAVIAGELAFESGSQQGIVRAGEALSIPANAPAHRGSQVVFEDWTGGLADDLPDGRNDAARLCAVTARRTDEAGIPRWPLVIQRLDAHVVVRGDLTVTTLDQTFSNPSSDIVEGLYTFHSPPGAVIQMFGVDRRGQMIEGAVRERWQTVLPYQTQVHQRSAHNPALLEWDALGRYHAWLYPIAPGATQRIRVRFTQWLDPDPRGRRVYRLPLAALGARISELRADFDLQDAKATSVTTGVDARMTDGHLYIARSDVIPRTDLVVELRGQPPASVTADRVSAPGDVHGNYLRVAVRPPAATTREARDEGIDLVVVVDHSAATDTLARRLSQAFVESLLAALDTHDRILVLVGDVNTRPLGAQTPELRAATSETRRDIIEALLSDRPGGATDIGAMIAQAQRALHPERPSAVVYVGDGNATVGSVQPASLRQTVARLSPRPRLYAVAVGETPRLDLLEALAESSGFAARIARRDDVARTTMDLLAHASRPIVRGVRVDLGPNTQAVYPTGAVDLPVGESLVVVGRFVTEPPRNVTVHANWNGVQTAHRISLEATDFNDGGDLRYRWANLRLEHLLARGESRPVVANLGTRYEAIAPSHTEAAPPPPADQAPQPSAAPSDDTTEDREVLRAIDLAVEQRSVIAVRDLTTRLRGHPQADARARTVAGEALLAIGDEAEARRAFTEIVEFAPDDPLARRRLGDVALSHGWADEAYRQFQMLAEMETDAPDVVLRQAMAARMAGRLDEAVRLAERVAEQSSTEARDGVADVAAAWIATELSVARDGSTVKPEVLEALRARWRRSPAARTSGALRVVLRWYHPDDSAELWVTLPGETQRRSELMGSAIYLESTVFSEAPPLLALEVRRGSTARPHGRAELIVLWNEGSPDEHVQRIRLDLDAAHSRYVLNTTPSGLTSVAPTETRSEHASSQGDAR